MPPYRLKLRCLHISGIASSNVGSFVHDGIIRLVVVEPLVVITRRSFFFLFFGLCSRSLSEKSDVRSIHHPFLAPTTWFRLHLVPPCRMESRKGDCGLRCILSRRIMTPTVLIIRSRTRKLDRYESVSALTKIVFDREKTILLNRRSGDREDMFERI